MKIDLTTPEGKVFAARYADYEYTTGKIGPLEIKSKSYFAKDGSEFVTPGAVQAVIAEIKQELDEKKAAVTVPKAAEELPAPPVAEAVKSVKESLSAQ